MARITVEDCLVKENNRFALVLLASERTKQLLGGSKPLTDSKGNKSVVTALREIADGQVTLLSGEESKKIREEREKIRLEKEAEKAASQTHGTNGSNGAPVFNVDDLFKTIPASASDDDEEDEIEIAKDDEEEVKDEEKEIEDKDDKAE